MPARHRYEYVRDYFASQGCRLLSPLYEGCSQILDYECQCGRRSRISFTTFQKGHRCKHCGIAKMARSRSHTYEYVKNFFTEHGCELLSTTYKNARKLLDYICRCNRLSKIRFDEFRKGAWCRKCADERLSKTFKLDYQYVKEFFAERGCELLSGTYENSWSLLDYRCSCGNISKIIFNSFQQGQRCGCGYKKEARRRAHNYEAVREAFAQKGCELLSSAYEGANSLLQYKCRCGGHNKTTFNNLKKIQGCMECAASRRVGDKNCRWNPDRDQVALIDSIRRRSIGMLNRQLKAFGIEKTAKSSEILGYSRETLRRHLQEHPNWSNVSKGKWQIDHIFPVSAFIRFGITDFKVINALENLQPLSGSDNREKWDSYEDEEFVVYLERKGINTTGESSIS